MPSGGDFVFSSDGTTVLVALKNIELGLGDGTTDFISITEGEGAFKITPDGLAGSSVAPSD